jgi:hypothetical protein
VEPGQAAEKNRPTNQPVTKEEIEQRAYQIYIERSGRDGDPMSDWLQAERELSGLQP